MKLLKIKLSYALYFVLVVGAFVFAFASCETGPNGDKIPLGNTTVQIMEFEGCEYVYLRRYGSVTITHKGNCKNTIHAPNPK